MDRVDELIQEFTTNKVYRQGEVSILLPDRSWSGEAINAINTQGTRTCHEPQVVASSSLPFPTLLSYHERRFDSASGCEHP